MKRLLGLVAVGLTSLAPAGAFADEMFGIGSNSLSASSSPDPTHPDWYSIAYRVMVNGSPRIHVQPRLATDFTTSRCPTTGPGYGDLGAPPGATELSSPSATTNGWVFVTALVNQQWGVWGQHLATGSDYCTGWSGSWTSLGALANGSPISTPSAFAWASTTGVWVFVTDSNHGIEWQYSGDGTIWNSSWNSVPDVSDVQSAPAATITHGNWVRLFWQDHHHRPIYHRAGALSLFGAINFTSSSSAISSVNFAGSLNDNIITTACAAHVPYTSQTTGANSFLAVACGTNSPGSTNRSYMVVDVPYGTNPAGWNDASIPGSQWKGLGSPFQSDANGLPATMPSLGYVAYWDSGRPMVLVGGAFCDPNLQFCAQNERGYGMVIDQTGTGMWGNSFISVPSGGGYEQVSWGFLP